MRLRSENSSVFSPTEKEKKERVCVKKREIKRERGMKRGRERRWYQPQDEEAALLTSWSTYR
jgi:hypothetical protein